MTVLVIDKTGWLRMFDPWIIHSKSIETIIIQVFTEKNAIDVAYLNFINRLRKKKKVIFLDYIGEGKYLNEVAPVNQKSIKKIKKSNFIETLFFLLDFLRYKSSYFKNYSFIRNRSLNWAPNKSRFFILFIYKLIPSFLSRYFTKFILFISKYNFFNKDHSLFNYINNNFTGQSLLFMPLCNATRLNYIQALTCQKLLNNSFIIYGMPGSWDNFTNKGIIKNKLSKLIVWNKIQEDESKELNPFHPNHVSQVGAIGMYKWINLKNKYPNKLYKNIEKKKKYRILYACSSKGICIDEIPCIKITYEAISKILELNSFEFIIRQHPKVKLDLENFTKFNNIKIDFSPSADTLDKDKIKMFDLFSSIDLIIGINTSLFVEIPLFGLRPVTLKEFEPLSFRHPHEKIIFNNSFGIIHTLTSFQNDLKSKKIFRDVTNRKEINKFTNKFHTNHLFSDNFINNFDHAVK